jgi:hypothetical protein
MSKRTSCRTGEEKRGCLCRCRWSSTEYPNLHSFTQRRRPRVGLLRGQENAAQTLGVFWFCPSYTCTTLSGNLNLTGTSSVSKIINAESDYRCLEMHADSTICVVLAQLREDKTTLIATIELHASFRRLLKRTLYCELFPWCEGAPMPTLRPHAPAPDNWQLPHSYLRVSVCNLPSPSRRFTVHMAGCAQQNAARIYTHAQRICV